MKRILEEFNNLSHNPFDVEYLNKIIKAREILLIDDFSFVEIGKEKSLLNSNIIINESYKISKIVKDIFYNNEILLKIKPREFEELICELFRSKNYIVELTKQTRDGGIDIIALKTLDNFPLKYLIECKRLKENRPVDIKIVRAFQTVISEQNANKGIIVTTSYFSSVAKLKQKQIPYLLDFKDSNDIIVWVKDYFNNFFTINRQIF